MKRITLEEKWEIGYEVLNKYFDLIEAGVDYPVVTVVTKYDTAKNLIEYLIESEFEIDSINISDPFNYGYDKEYSVMLTEDGVSCIPLWHEKNEYYDAGYYMTGGDIVLVDEDCNSIILEYIDAPAKDVVEFGVDDECDGDCENCIFDDNDEDTNDKSTEDYDVSIKVNGEEVRGQEAVDAIKRLLLDYCEMMDRKNELLSHFWF